MNDWYQNLNRPPLTPPDAVFGPVWTILYIMIAVSVLLFIRTPKKEGSGWIYLLLAVHLAANFAWTFFFFRLQSPGLALIDIIFLDGTLIALILLFRNYSPLAALLLVPYFLWVSFATYLNSAFYFLNRGS